MNIAIVTDDLIQRGGQELLVRAISEIWPHAPIYTCYASDYWLKYYSSQSVQIITAPDFRLPFFKKLSRYYFLLLSHIRAYESFDFSEYDVVVSITSRYAQFIITKPQTLHFCYVNSPGRMFWEASNYFAYEKFGILSPLKKFAQGFLQLPLQINRVENYLSFRRPDKLIANSISIQRKISKYINRESDVIYPFFDNVPAGVNNTFKGDYYLIITRLAPWKRVDIAVKACSELGLKLIVVGRGPEVASLRSIAGPTVEIKDDVHDPEKLTLLQNCKALIHTQHEDFGIVPLEAMSFGKPVLAFAAGGALETVIDGITGAFFHEQTVQSLKRALQLFNSDSYDAKNCIYQAMKFTKDIFQRKLQKYIEQEFSRMHNV